MLRVEILMERYSKPIVSVYGQAIERLAPLKP
jgi:hypothetical protein